MADYGACLILIQKLAPKPNGSRRQVDKTSARVRSLTLRLGTHDTETSFSAFANLDWGQHPEKTFFSKFG